MANPQAGVTPLIQPLELEVEGRAHVTFFLVIITNSSPDSPLPLVIEFSTSFVTMMPLS